MQSTTNVTDLVTSLSTDESKIMKT